MRTLLAISLFFVSSVAFAKAERLQCSKNHLAPKTCSLKGFNLRVQVTEGKISLFDGTWRQLLDFPLKSDKIEWQEARLVKIGKRHFLDVKLWDEPRGEAQIQSLRWLGYEFIGPSVREMQLNLKWDEVLQKRTLVKEQPVPPARSRGQFETPVKPQYLLDKKEKFEIFIDKTGTLVWRVGNKKRSEKDSESVP